MGYLYSRSGGLVCDSCGDSKGVRKRKCPHTVSGLPYCSPPALCSDCYKQEGGIRIHDKCKEPAAASQREDDEIAAQLAAGAFQRSTAWGDWRANVPEGLVGVKFVGSGGNEEYYLLPDETYNAHRFLHEYSDAVPWENPPVSASKCVHF